MDTDSFVIYIKPEDFYKDIASDVEKWFDTSNYDRMIKDHFQQVSIKKLSVCLKMNQEERLRKNFVRLEQKYMHT